MRKKILFLLPRFTTGGAEKLVLEYCRRLPKGQFEIAVASSRGGGELTADFQSLGIPVIVGDPGHFFGTVKKIKKFVGDWSPDIVHTHIFSADVVGYFLKTSHKKIVWISTAHNVETEASFFRKWVWRYVLGSVDRVIAVSGAVAKFYLSDFHIPKEKLILLPNAIDPAPYLTVPAPSAKAPIQLATIGRLTHQKGQDVLLQALARIPVPWQLHIFGEGEEKNTLEDLSKRLGIGDRIVWHGVAADMPKALASIDVVVQPSRYEGMSLVTLEAMAAGRAIVATPPAAGEYLYDHESSLIVAIDDVRGLSQAIEQLIQNHPLILKLGAAAQQKIRTVADLSSHIERLKRIYEDAIV